MSSNIVKGGYVMVTQEKTVSINSDALVRKKLEELKKRQLEELEAENDNAEESVDEFVEGIDPVQVARLVSDEPVEAPEAAPQPAPIIKQADIDRAYEEAQAESERIINEARVSAEKIMSDARSDGYNQGYSEGMAKADEEINAHKIRIESEYEELKQSLENSVNERMAEIEPMLIEKLTEIYEHILGVSLSDSTSTVVFLLKKSLGTMDSNRNYIIHVSGEDIDDVRENKSSLSKASGIKEELLEIIEDNSLSKNGCMIESDGGIFDVGLDTQLGLLKKQLRILSMSADES